MNIAQIRKFDIANGEGIRTTLFVSGCHFHCKGCFNVEYQNFNYGKPLTKEVIDDIVDSINNPNVFGLSILGGEPLDQDIGELRSLLTEVKARTQKTIWMWTGYIFENLEEVQKQVVLDCVDMLVDGQFIEELKDLTLAFRGSSNQRILQVEKLKLDTI